MAIIDFIELESLRVAIFGMIVTLYRIVRIDKNRKLKLFELILELLFVFYFVYTISPIVKDLSSSNWAIYAVAGVISFCGFPTLIRAGRILLFKRLKYYFNQDRENKENE